MRPMIALFAALPLAALATVNVNTAQQSELQRTKGLDKYKAKAIIEYRAQNGAYDSLDDLEKAVGKETADKIRPVVAFNGPAFVPGEKSEKPEKADKTDKPEKPAAGKSSASSKKSDS